MKARKVAILLEVETAIPVKELRDEELLELRCGGYDVGIVQVSVNVIKPSK